MLYKNASDTFAWFPTGNLEKHFLFLKVCFPLNSAGVSLLGTKNGLLSFLGKLLLITTDGVLDRRPLISSLLYDGEKSWSYHLKEQIPRILPVQKYFGSDVKWWCTTKNKGSENFRVVIRDKQSTLSHSLTLLYSKLKTR